MERFAAYLESSMRQWGVSEDTLNQNEAVKSEHGTANAAID